MATLLEKLHGIFASRSATAERTLNVLAEKEAKGEKFGEKETAALERALTDVQIDGSVYSEKVALWKRRLELQAACSKAMVDSTVRESVAAFRALEDFDTETRKIILERDETRRHMFTASWNAAKRSDLVSRAQAELEVLEYECRELFQLTPPDLDRYTLKTLGNQILQSEKDAPELTVPDAVFHEQGDRRRALMAHARKAALEKHLKEMEAHNSRYQKHVNDVGWQHLGKHPFSEALPALPELVWADVVKTLPK